MRAAILARTAVPVLILALVTVSNTACRPAFMTRRMEAKAWRLDDHRVVMVETETQSYALNPADREFNYDEVRYKISDPDGGTWFLSSIRAEGDGGSGSGVNLASLEVRTDTEKQRLWFVDKNEQRVVYSVAVGEGSRPDTEQHRAIWENLEGTSALQALERFEHTTDQGVTVVGYRPLPSDNTNVAREANEAPEDPGS